MRPICRFRDLPEWPEAKRMLSEEVGLDDAMIAHVGDQEGDSLDLVETCMAVEEAFGSNLKKQARH